MAGDFDASEPTAAELRAEAKALSERAVTLLVLGTFAATPRASKLLFDCTNHLANAVSALNAALLPEAEDPYADPGPLPPFHRNFRRTEPDGTPAPDIAQER